MEPESIGQREGRIDRYGQCVPVVKSFLLHGRDNPIDKAVLDVLIRKAVEIHKTLGITVPVPMEVETRTALLLLRLRHLLEGQKQESLLAEECLVAGFTGSPSNPLWLETEAALSLLQSVQPVKDLPLQFKQTEVKELLDRLDELEDELRLLAEMRSQVLAQSHRRVRAITKEGQRWIFWGLYSSTRFSIGEVEAIMMKAD